MKLTTAPAHRATEIAALFETTFTASEGAEEGRLIGHLARDMIARTDPADLRVFVSQDGDALTGAILFSRLRFRDDARVAFLLAPVAVRPDHQGRGLGQALLRHGLDALRAEGAEIAVTYGDPAYYGRVGFVPVSTDTVPAPRPLQFPEGWLAQPLTGRPLTPLPGPAHCVAAIDDAAYW